MFNGISTLKKIFHTNSEDYLDINEKKALR